MSVKELKQEWLDVLKHKLYYADWEDLYELCDDDIITQEELCYIIDDCMSFLNIPNEIVYKVFDGVDFVKGDFESE